jgi:UDP-glucuronate 4-epimerase
LSLYYDRRIKNENVKSNYNKRFKFVYRDITDRLEMEKLFRKYQFDIVIHLAAQDGEGYSISNPLFVNNVNINGFDIIARLSALSGVKHFIYASSSVVYGDEGEMRSPYAVTKATNELQASMYSNMYKMRFTGLRLFGVYGERMRPDLAIARFATAILDKNRIHVYGTGIQMRDFTYVGDVVDAIKLVIETDKEWKCEVFDVGRGFPISINKVIDTLKEVCYTDSFDDVVYEKQKSYSVKLTLANPSKMRDMFGFTCKTDIKTGLTNYINWLNEERASE